MNLIMFCYNFMRTKNILGFDKMLQQIQNWTPDYNKVICALKNAFIKAIYGQNEQPFFLNCIRYFAIFIQRLFKSAALTPK